MLNSFNFAGRLSHEPEVKTLPSGKTVCNFTVAVQKNFKNQNGEYETDFFNCIAFGATGDLVAKYFSKGDFIVLGGEVHIRKYTDRDGNNRSVTEISVSSVTFVGKKGDKAADSNEPVARDLGVSVEGELSSEDDLPF